jgi:hypothetical protein
MKLRNLSIFAVAAMMAACGGGDDTAAEGGDTTGVAVDTSMMAPAPMPMDTGMAAPMPMDSGAMGTDTTGMSTDSMADTTKTM